MKNLTLHLMAFVLIFSFFNSSAISISNKENDAVQKPQETTDEIVFYTNDSIFSPVVVLQGSATILWTWDDNSTTNSATPYKVYGSSQLRKNTLKVTPWSAVRRINIGYDAQDGGSSEIELVGDQHVSKVENLNLVAPYLKEWCSSYNMLTSLDFSNFVNLETIECFLSVDLQSVNLTNTPKLKRACFVVNSLTSLDVSDCVNLQEVLAGDNKFTNIILPNKADSLWYIGARDNIFITNTLVYNNLSKYPNIAHLSIWNSNQKGSLVIPKSNPTKWVWIRGYENQYSSIDFRGSLQNFKEIGYVDMHNNKLTDVEIAGCKEIRTLDLSNNLLSSEMVDHILKDMDEFDTVNIARYANLSENNPPTKQGLIYKKSLQAKGWNVITDSPTSTQMLTDSPDFIVYPNPSSGRFKLHINNIPKDGVVVELTNINGQKLITKKVYDNDTEFSINQFSGKMFFLTLRDTNTIETKRIIIE